MDTSETPFKLAMALILVFGGILLICSPILLVGSLVQSFRTKLKAWNVLAVYSTLLCLPIPALLLISFICRLLHTSYLATQLLSILGTLLYLALLLVSPILLVSSIIQSLRTKLLPWLLLAIHTGIYCLFNLAIIAAAVIGLTM